MSMENTLMHIAMFKHLLKAPTTVFCCYRLTSIPI